MKHRIVGSWRSSRWLRRLVVGVIALYATYLLAANVLLGFHLLDRIVTADDGSVELRTRRAWSLWPGRASVRGFMLRLDSDDLQLRLEVERATTTVSLWRLLRREVHLSDAEVSGTSFRLRMRVEAIGPQNAERVAAYAPIEGALGPPLFSAAPVVEHTPPEKAWHVDLVNVGARVDEVWIQEYRLQGSVWVGGGFALWPGKDFMLRPSLALVHEGVVHVGEREITRDFVLEAGTAEIDRVSLPETKGSDVLRHLVAAGHGDSTLQDSSFLDVYAGHGVPKIRVQPSKSTFAARFVRGQFVQGTTATVNVPEGSLHMKELALGGAAVLRVRAPLDGELELGADTNAGRIALDALPSTKKNPWTLHGTSLRQVLHVVVGDPVRPGLGAYKGELRTPTLGWFEDLAELGVTTKGTATATFELTRDGNGRIHGPWQARIEDGVIASDSLTTHVSNTAHGGISTQPNPAEGVSVVGAVVEAPRALAKAANGPARTTWMRADVASASVAFEPRFAIKVAADLSAGDGGFVASVVESQAGLVLGPIAAQFLKPPVMKARIGVAAVESEYTVSVPNATVGLVDAKAHLDAPSGKEAARRLALQPAALGGFPPRRRRAGGGALGGPGVAGGAAAVRRVFAPGLGRTRWKRPLREPARKFSKQVLDTTAGFSYEAASSPVPRYRCGGA